MIAKLIVAPPDRFDAWMAGKNISFAGAEWKNMPAGERLLFERGCMSCHSIEGAAMVGPTFKGLFGASVTVRTDGGVRSVVADSAYIYKSIISPGADIVDGFPNTMPPGRDAVSDEEITQIIKYLKTLK
jgi:cytochrome c oxidase subunit 2